MEMLDALNEEGQETESDLGLLRRTIESYRLIFHQNPIAGENREVVAALTGRNPHRLIFLDPAHPALSASNELLDRWGTPFRFHPGATIANTAETRMLLLQAPDQVGSMQVAAWFTHRKEDLHELPACQRKNPCRQGSTAQINFTGEQYGKTAMLVEVHFPASRECPWRMKKRDTRTSQVSRLVQCLVSIKIAEEKKLLLLDVYLETLGKGCVSKDKSDLVLSLGNLALATATAEGR